MNRKEVYMSFGQVISNARKKAQLSQKDLAQKIVKEDGEPISPQYLNDIERDRRNPPSEHILRQFAKELNLSSDYLKVLAGKLPDDIEVGEYKPEQIDAAIRAFRKTLKND
jgi:transcriptional regulator with XRE-family HTH domain